jgi:hypothetical protein
MFAALAIERDPLRYSDFGGGFFSWIMVAGALAAIFLLLWLAFGWSQWRPTERAAVPRWQVGFFFVCCILSVLAYVLFGLFSLAGLARGTTDQSDAVQQSLPLTTIFLIAGGFFAVLAVGMPFVLNLHEQRIRRIFALAKLSFKEAIRRRVLYAFSAMLIVFLFASWYIPSKAEDQVRTYVQVFFKAMSILLLFTTAVLSAFSIPTDIKQQTIHTIVTKPVQRFEVVLGRFFGFLALMTLVLLVMTGVSLAFVIRGVNPEAAEESLKARDPLYGELRYENTNNEREGINVGREWNYRSYITARSNPSEPPQTARWDFTEIPAVLGEREKVLCEYGFDVYRTTKGKEGAPVSCTFKFYTWRFKRGNDELFIKKRGPLAGLTPQRASDLAEEFGYFELNALPVVDYHTQQFTLPPGLFKNAAAADPDREEELRRNNDPKPPLLRMRVTCDSRTQYVGMAKHDMYIRLDDTDRSETLLFAINFFKAAFGLWLRIALILGLAVVLSTYLSGVISLLVTLVLYLFGVNKEFIQEVALGKNVGGGPLEAMVRLTRRELTGPSLKESAATGDQIVAANLVIPDVDRFDLTNYVAEGFNITTEQMITSGAYLFIYLLPWAVLAYFLIKWREVASAN